MGKGAQPGVRKSRRNERCTVDPRCRPPQKRKTHTAKMGYRCKRNSAGEIASREASCSARGDKMLPHKHYDPSKTTRYMADETTVRTLFGIAATHRMHIKHINIKSAYLHEKFAHNGSETVYVKQPPRFNGTYKHQCQRGKLNMKI